MPRNVCTKYVLAVSLLFFALTAFAQSRTPGPLKGVDVEQLLNAQVPLDAHFKNEKGEDVSIGGLLKDKAGHSYARLL